MAAQHAQAVASGRDNPQPLPDSPPQLQDSPRRMEDSMFVTQRSARPRRAMDATRNTSESSYRPSSRSSQSGPTPEPSPEKREDVTHDDEENGIQNLAAAASKADLVFNDQAHAERQAREDMDRNAQHIADMQKQELDKAREFAESMAREAQEQARQMVEKQSRESEERKTQELKEQITRELEEKQAREIAQKMAQIEKEKQEAVDLAERRARFAEQRAREYAYGITAQVADWTKTGPQEVMRKALQEAQSGVHPPPAQPDMPGHPESQACTAINDQGGAAPFSSRRRPNHEAAAALAAQRERARSPGAALAAATQDRSSRQPGRPKLQASTPIKVEDGAAPFPSRRRPNHEVAAAEAAQEEHTQTPATRFAPVLRLSRPQPQATTPTKDPNRSFQEALARSNPGRAVAIADTHAERPGITGSQRFNTNTEPRLPVSQTHASDDQSQSVTEAADRRPAIPEKPARRPLPTSRPASRAPTAAGARTTPAKGTTLGKKRPHPLSPAEDTPAGDAPTEDTPAEGTTAGGPTAGSAATGDAPIPGSREVQEALSSNPAVARARHRDGEAAALDMVDTANSMLALSRDRSHVRYPDGKRGADGRDRPEVRANEEEVRRQREAVVVGRGRGDEGERKPEKKRQKKDDDVSGGGGGGGGGGSGGEKAKRGAQHNSQKPTPHGTNGTHNSPTLSELRQDRQIHKVGPADQAPKPDSLGPGLRRQRPRVIVVVVVVVIAVLGGPAAGGLRRREAQVPEHGGEEAALPAERLVHELVHDGLVRPDGRGVDVLLAREPDLALRARGQPAELGRVVDEGVVAGQDEEALGPRDPVLAPAMPQSVVEGLARRVGEVGQRDVAVRVLELERVPVAVAHVDAHHLAVVPLPLDRVRPDALLDDPVEDVLAVLAVEPEQRLVALAREREELPLRGPPLQPGGFALGVHVLVRDLAAEDVAGVDGRYDQGIISCRGGGRQFGVGGASNRPEYSPYAHLVSSTKNALPSRFASPYAIHSDMSVFPRPASSDSRTYVRLDAHTAFSARPFFSTPRRFPSRTAGAFPVSPGRTPCFSASFTSKKYRSLPDSPPIRLIWFKAAGLCGCRAWTREDTSLHLSQTSLYSLVVRGKS
ncbi:hypothetical protein VPNG_00066 [Cytospora leucostoma]|uniref:Uncharacterized protein n=1 Tax=Cytospora leucostoma TaxID=1230097 RepID=A0A423XNI6_9PEZI|nr:hypothetical protein VPNG_00066 [Cytospora leucostoma]